MEGGTKKHLTGGLSLSSLPEWIFRIVLLSKFCGWVGCPNYCAVQVRVKNMW